MRCYSSLLLVLCLSNREYIFLLLYYLYQKMMGCQIPAFGMWNYCSDLSITQYFDSAMQARLMKRWNCRGSAAAAAVVVGEKGGVAGGEQLVLFRTPSFQRKPAAQIKVCFP
jgi:hypothetical protein